MEIQTCFPDEKLAHGLIHMTCRDLACPHSGCHSSDHSGRILRLQQQVMPGFERFDADSFRTKALDYVLIP
jgi:hypothetical protein